MFTSIKEKAFPQLDEDDIAQLLPLATCQSFTPGETILHFGQSDIDLIIVESGSIEIRNPIDGDKLIVTLGPGHFVGDIIALASEDEASPETLVNYGFNESFKKPFDVVLLTERIRSLVEEKRSNL